MAGATKSRAEWEALLAQAHAAGQAAAEATVPEPMVVYEAAGLSDRPKAGGKSWFVAGGLCGFATVVIRPARGGLVQLLKSKGVGYKHYYGGWAVPIHAKVDGPLSQSVEIKEAYAAAFVKVFRDAGVTGIGYETRLD